MSDYMSKQEQSLDIAGGMEVTQGRLRDRGMLSSGMSSSVRDSEEYFEYSCDPCKGEGFHAEAAGFCTVCKDYLCAVCFKEHKKNKASKHHSLLDSTAMSNMSTTCDPCKRDGDDKEIDGYCKTCDQFMCSKCLKIHSNSRVTRNHVLMNKDSMPNLSAFRAVGNTYNSQKYTYIRGINVRSTGDLKNCFITDMTLINNIQLILSDNNNKSLKLVDLEQNDLKYTLSLETYPGGLEALSYDQIAVTLEDKCSILIISVSKELTVARRLKTAGKCVDISCVNGKLYVSFKDPVKFEILSMSGAVTKTIVPCTNVMRHCVLPRYIAVSRDESKIYISDWRTNNVLCMDMDGKVVALFQGDTYLPKDICISPFGIVYLCNRGQNLLYKMNPDLSEATVISGPEDGLKLPHAMCFNISRHQLYISSAHPSDKYLNTIKVLQWK